MYVHDHPIYLEKTAYKKNYCRALNYFVRKYLDDSESLAILDNFCHTLLWNNYDNTLVATPLKDQEIEYSLKKVAFNAKNSTKPAYRLAFLLDCCFICAFDDESKAKTILCDLKPLFTDRYTQKKSKHLLSALYHNAKIKKPKTRNDLYKDIVCYKEQKDFFTRLPKTFLVTAYHKSVGKATLINAIIGKKLLHPNLTQDYGSGHIHLLCSKAIEDHKIAIQGLYHPQGCNLAPSPSTKQNVITTPAPNFLPLTYYNFYDQEDIDLALDVIAQQVNGCQIGTKYHNLVEVKNQLCVIDTPSINAAQINAKITKEAITTYTYDSLIYVFNTEQWGSDEECTYLQYLAQNIPQEKIVFVLNKIDLCHGNNSAINFIDSSTTGSIDGTIEAVKAKLSQLGYNAPQIYPLCAYFSMLNKLELTKVLTTDHEGREFYRYVDLYSQAENDLSHYCHKPHNNLSCDLMTQMSVKCGLHALECRLLQDQ